jgi:hypothetical protein
MSGRKESEVSEIKRCIACLGNENIGITIVQETTRQLLRSLFGDDEAERLPFFSARLMRHDESKFEALGKEEKAKQRHELKALLEGLLARFGESGGPTSRK